MIRCDRYFKLFFPTLETQNRGTITYNDTPTRMSKKGQKSRQRNCLRSKVNLLKILGEIKCDVISLVPVLLG